MKRKYAVLDKRTGEILDAVSLHKRRTAPNWGFYMGGQTKERAFYRDPEITKGELRVYGLLKCDLDYSNSINLTQTEMAHELNMDIAQVNKAVNSLIRKGILEKVIHQGRWFTYKMNPEFARKGNELRRVK